MGGQDNFLKADLFQQKRNHGFGGLPSKADLKGSPLQGGETGCFADLGKVTPQRLQRAGVNPKDMQSIPSSLQKVVATLPSTAVASSSISAPIRRSSRNSGNTNMETRPAKSSAGNKKRVTRPWQALGESETIMEIEPPDEALAVQKSAAGVSEGDLAVTQVLALDKKARLAAWDALKKEFSVQEKIWQSVAFVKKAQMAALGKKDGEVREPAEAMLAKEFDLVLSRTAADPDGAVKALEETLEMDAHEYKLLSRSMIEMSRSAIMAEAMTKRRQKLLVEIVEATHSAPSISEEVKGKNKRLEDVSSLLLSCELGRNPLAYCVRRILSWSLGAPQSGLVVPLSAAWTLLDEDVDPWEYGAPDPSLSPPGSEKAEEAEKVVRKARANLTSLQVKQKKKTKAAGMKGVPSRGVVEANPEPPPIPPPASQLPALPGYGLSDPLSGVPVDPTGIAKIQPSTSTGSSSCGEPNSQVFLSL